MRERIDRLSTRVTAAASSVWALPLALVVVLLWAISGPFLRFSDLWQLSINTGTTIITFVMVFAIQRSTSRDTLEIKAMLAELVEDIAEVDEVRARERAEEVP